MTEREFIIRKWLSWLGLLVMWIYPIENNWMIPIFMTNMMLWGWFHPERELEKIE